MDFLPRVIRLKDAHQYLGMDKNRFNSEVRPYITEVPTGKQGIGFDRVDLDNWFEEYKASNGRPGKAMKGGIAWGKNQHQDSENVVTPGTSGRQSEIIEFEKDVTQAILGKPKST